MVSKEQLFEIESAEFALLDKCCSTFSSHFKQLFVDVKTKNSIKKKILREFQDALKISTSNPTIEYENIGELLLNLIEAYTDEKDEDIEIDDFLNDFMNECYCSVARELWKDPYLVYDNVTPVERRQNHNRLMMLIQCSVKKNLNRFIENFLNRAAPRFLRSTPEMRPHSPSSDSVLSIEEEDRITRIVDDENECTNEEVDGKNECDNEEVDDEQEIDNNEDKKKENAIINEEPPPMMEPNTFEILHNQESKDVDVNTDNEASEENVKEDEDEEDHAEIVNLLDFDPKICTQKDDNTKTIELP